MTQPIPAHRHAQRRGTAAAWAAWNGVLGDGEIGWETDTKLWKIGDGSTVWNGLAYSSGPPPTLTFADPDTLAPGSASTVTATMTEPGSYEITLGLVKGDKGDVGPAGLTWRLAWDEATQYAVDDAVYYSGSSYYVPGPSAPDVGVAPDPSKQSPWMELAVMGQKGDKGDQGPTGPTGPAGGLPVTPATLTAGPDDAQALVAGSYYCPPGTPNLPPGCGEGLLEVFTSNSGHMYMQRYTDYRRGLRYERRQFDSGYAPRTFNLLTADQATAGDVSGTSPFGELSGKGTVARDTSRSQAGAGCVKFTNTAAGPGNLSMTPKLLPPVGLTFAYSVYVYIPSSNSALTTLHAFCNGAVSNVSYGMSSGSDAWVRTTVTATVASSSAIYCYVIANGGAVGDAAYVDSAQMECAPATTGWTYPDANPDEIEFPSTWTAWRAA